MVLNGTKPLAIKNGPTPPKSPMRQALPQIIAASVKNIVLLSFGLTLGYPTILIPSFLNPNSADSFTLNAEQISWIGSVNLICVPAGCLLSGAVTQAIGRKRAMQLNNIPFLCAWLLFAFSTSVWQVFLALCITGLNGGLLEAPVLTYLAEIAQPHLRGILSSTSSMAVIFGVLAQFLLGTFLPWRQVALINCSVPIVSFLLLFFIPESPHWLIMQNRLAEARRNIAWLRGWTTVEAVDAEFRQLCAHLGKSLQGVDNPAFLDDEGAKIIAATQQNLNAENPPRKFREKLGLFSKKTFLRPYGLVSFVFFLANFGGLSTLQTYAVQIFATLQAPIDRYYATVILGVAQLAGSVLCVCVIHYTGKRKLCFVSLIICSFCYVVTATYAYIIDVKYLLTDAAAGGPGGAYSWLPLAALIFAAFMANTGIRVLPWILTGEVYTNETRAAASGLSSAISYVFAFLANKVFFYMINSMTLPGMYWFYGALNLFGFVVLYFILPETEGKTLHEIIEHFAGARKLGWSVKRRRQPKVGVVSEGFCGAEGESRL